MTAPTQPEIELYRVRPVAAIIAYSRRTGLTMYEAKVAMERACPEAHQA